MLNTLKKRWLHHPLVERDFSYTVLLELEKLSSQVMSNMLPPILMPKYIEFSGSVIQLYDPDFHKKSPEQPEDPRWVKVSAPFVFTGSELTTEKLETTFNPNKGVYETSPIIKVNGGVLLRMI